MDSCVKVSSIQDVWVGFGAFDVFVDEKAGIFVHARLFTPQNRRAHLVCGWFSAQQANLVSVSVWSNQSNILIGSIQRQFGFFVLVELIQ